MVWHKLLLTKEEKQLRNRTAESFASFAISIWTIVIIGYIKSTSSSFWANYYAEISFITYLAVALGGLFALFSFYLILCWDCKQKFVLKYLERTQIAGFIKLIGWFIVLFIFAHRLIQTGNVLLCVTGTITFLIALTIYAIGLFKMNTT